VASAAAAVARNAAYAAAALDSAVAITSLRRSLTPRWAAERCRSAGPSSQEHVPVVTEAAR
jgi:hypothetical protein